MGLFDGPDYDAAQKIYGDYEKKILDYINQSQATGRGDISSGLAKAETYGKPYMEAGTQSLDALMQSVGLGPKSPSGDLSSQFQRSPGYQYAVREATNAAQRQAAATGQHMSGAELRGISKGAEGEASKDWMNWLFNYQNRLSNIAGMGQQTAGQQAGLTAQGGFNLANLGLGWGQLATTEMEMAAKAKAEAELAKGANDGGLLSALGTVAGGVGGYFLGGPQGALTGAKIGSNIGK